MRRALAIALLAVSDDLIYYSSEFKQYSSDVLIALGCAFLVLGPSRSEGTVGRFLGAFAGGLATWFSFSSIFVLAAGGVWLAATALVRKDWERLIVLSVIGAVWLVNFTACYVISKRLLGDGDWMWVWWGFSFLPLPPRSLGDLSSLFWTIANLFTNPAGLDTPISPITTGLLGLGLYGVGLMRWVRDRKGAALAILVGPLALAMVASAARLYPFHGRTILYLAPLLILAVAEGAAIFARPRWRWAAVALVTFFLIVPLGRFAMNFERPRSRMFDSHGDQRNDLLDYLEMRHNRFVAPTPSSTP